MDLEYRSPSAEEFEAVFRTAYVAFSEEMKEGDLDRARATMPADRVLAAWGGDRPVGVAASYPFELTVPGGVVAAGGVTWVGVIPTHRRRGVLSELMRRQLEDLRTRGEPVAILWASEAPIYGRFGYGVAVPETSIEAEKSAFALRDDPGPRGSVRIVAADEALELLPPLHERHRRDRPGLIARTEEWWKRYLLADPEHWRDGYGPKFLALLELDGEPAGWVSYRVKSSWEDDTPRGTLRVLDLFGATRDATAELWRFLFAIDLVTRVQSGRVDPSFLLLVTDYRRMHAKLNEGIWLRLVDVEAALRARTFGGSEPVVLEVTDDLLPANAGRWSVAEAVERTDADADVAIDVADLASAYLGAFTFEELAAAGRARELRPRGLARATARFWTPLPPLCPEGF